MRLRHVKVEDTNFFLSQLTLKVRKIMKIDLFHFNYFEGDKKLSSFLCDLTEECSVRTSTISIYTYISILYTLVRVQYLKKKSYSRSDNFKVSCRYKWIRFKTCTILC